MGVYRYDQAPTETVPGKSYTFRVWNCNQAIRYICKFEEVPLSDCEIKDLAGFLYQGFCRVTVGAGQISPVDRSDEIYLGYGRHDVVDDEDND